LNFGQPKIKLLEFKIKRTSGAMIRYTTSIRTSQKYFYCAAFQFQKTALYLKKNPGFGNFKLSWQICFIINLYDEIIFYNFKEFDLKGVVSVKKFFWK
jgi:hypothetical protein